MEFHFRLTGCSLLACGLLFIAPCAETAPVLPLTIDSVSFGSNARQDFISLYGVDFSFSTATQGTGIGNVFVPYGQNLGYEFVSFDNTYASSVPHGYQFYYGTINYAGTLQSAQFTGSAIAISTSAVFAPYSAGSVTAYTTVTGSFTACLTVTENSLSNCDTTLPTYTLSFSLPGYIHFDFGNGDPQVAPLTLTIGANAPVPEPSSFALLCGGLLFSFGASRYMAMWRYRRPAEYKDGSGASLLPGNE